MKTIKAKIYGWFLFFCWLASCCGCGIVRTNDFESTTLFKDIGVTKVTVTKPDGTKIEIEGGTSNTNAEAFKAGIEGAMKAGLDLGIRMGLGAKVNSGIVINP